MKQIHFKQNQSGWSLQELILVLAIIAILALLFWPQIKGARIGAELGKVDTLITQIQTVLKDSFVEQNPNEYPPQAKVLNPPTLVTWATPTNLSGMQELINYLQYCKKIHGVSYNAKGSYDCDYDSTTSQSNPIIQDEFAFLMTNTEVQACVTNHLKYIQKISGDICMGYTILRQVGPGGLVIGVQCTTISCT